MLTTRLMWFATLVALLSACNGVRGSGVPASEDRPVEAFSRVELGGAFEFELTVGAAPSLTLSADDNLLPLITSEVVDGTLTLGIEEAIRPRSPIRAVMTTPALASADISGAANGSISGIASDRFDLSCSGACEVSLGGTAPTVTVDISGAGNVQARQLTAVDFTVAVSGAADASVCASGVLDATISGAGTIDYYCDPSEVRRSVSGAGSIGPGSN